MFRHNVQNNRLNVVKPVKPLSHVVHVRPLKNLRRVVKMRPQLWLVRKIANHVHLAHRVRKNVNRVRCQ
ncbi:hypothetical protein D3C80_2145250 [compost metagenome]